jgi:tellurium resistance protein TerZ
MINLSKGGRINLSKDEKGNSFDKIFFGSNWGMIKSGGWFSSGKTAVDLDSTVILVDAQGNHIDTIYFGHKDAPGVHHFGDDLTGDADGDDGMDNETISIQLSRIDSRVEHVFFVLNIYNTDSVESFDEIPYMGLRIYVSPNNKPKEKVSDPVTILAKYNLTKGDNDFKGKSSLVLGEAYRRNGEWKFKAIGEFGNYSGRAGISQLERRVKEFI